MQRDHDRPRAAGAVFADLRACRLSCVLLLALGGGCGGPSPATVSRLPVYFTCDTRGRLEPCGCFKGQFGGLTRLKTVLSAEAPLNALRVDVGDSIGGKEDFDIIQYHYMLQAFAAMKYDAVNIGHREARLSLGQLRELKRQSPVPLVSANLLDKASGQLVFDALRFVERDGLRIALVGLLEPRGITEELGEGLAVADMATTLAKLLPELRSKADMIVLLAFADETAMSQLAQQFYEVRLILGGRVKQSAQEVKRENRSLIYFVTNEARALGILRLQVQKGGPVSVQAKEIRFLHDGIPQDPSFQALAQTYRDEIRQTRLAIDDPAKTASDAVPGVRVAATYVGNAACVACHPSAEAVWSGSAHAHAFATLISRRADADPKCIGCHTTGLGSLSGYQRAFGKQKLVDAGCESCHGPGSLHVRQREGDTSVDFTYRPLGAGDCQKCHYGEFSRPFHWDEFWPVIKHGKEPEKPATSTQL